MQQGEWEVVILKPTHVFLSFIASQLPDVELPDLRLLHTDTTAYVIRKYQDEEETLSEIENYFPKMFRHEVKRWLGTEAYREVEASFLDFLCCFKFELHSQIVLMESDIEEGQRLLCIKPRSVLLKWMKSAIEEPSQEIIEALEEVSVANLAENATVVIKNFKQLGEIKLFIQQYYRPIFKAEMLRMCDRTEFWPQVHSFQEFSRYFTVEIHTQLVHLH
jgi:hypothetical protein